MSLPAWLEGLADSGELWSAACAALWAVAVILFRKGGELVGPVPLNLFKNTLGLLLFLLTMLALGVPLVPDDQPLSAWLILAGSGALAIGLADSIFFAALNRLGAGRAAIVECLYAPLMVLFGWVYLGEPLGPAVLGGAGLLVAAVLLGTYEPAGGGAAPGADRLAREPARQVASASARRALLEGVALGATAMVLMAAGIVWAKPVLERCVPWWANAVRLAGGIAILGPQVLLLRQGAAVRRAFRPGRHWRLLVPSTVVGSYLALFAWIYGVSLTAAGVAGVLNMTSTLWVLLLATLLLKEPLTWRKAAAVALGMVGGVVVTL